jgi:hypothetical protein
MGTNARSAKRSAAKTKGQKFRQSLTKAYKRVPRPKKG